MARDLRALCLQTVLKFVQGWTPVEFFLGKTRSIFQPRGKGRPLILPIGRFLHGPLPFLKTLEANLSVEVDSKPMCN